MVHVATRGDEVPARLGPDVPQLPGWGTTVVDREVYADPVRFELEREHVLRRSWILAGRSVEIPEPGDWLSFEGHGETAVITRQRDGSHAAFHNVCQHRGPSFVKADKGCGARRFSCPYHGWVYDTTGKLVGVPEREDFDAEELQGLRAPLAKADEWGGWIWLYLDGDDAPRTVAVPQELASVADAWARLSYSSQRRIAEGIASAKKPETRSARVEKALAELGG